MAELPVYSAQFLVSHPGTGERLPLRDGSVFTLEQIQDKSHIGSYPDCLSLYCAGDAVRKENPAPSFPLVDSGGGGGGGWKWKGIVGNDLQTSAHTNTLMKCVCSHKSCCKSGCVKTRSDG